MKEGILGFNFGSERYEIAFYEGGPRKELHCGDTFQIKVGDEWKSTRIEFDWEKEEWYLVDISEDDWSTGAKVRV